MDEPSLPLLFPHYTPADAWACLPPRARDQAQDYLRGERLAPRHYGGGLLLARLAGYTATRVPYARHAGEGWRVGCSCGRRQPCPHVGALIMAWAEDPESFAPLLLQPGEDEKTLVAWATGEPFLWDELSARAEALRRGGMLGALDRLAPERRAEALALWTRTHAAFVRDPWSALVASAVRGPCAPAEALRWLQLLYVDPELDLTAVLDAVRPEAAVEPLLLGALYAVEADALSDARPSRLLAARTLGLWLADRLDRQGRGREVPALFGRFRTLESSGLALGDWLYTHGQGASARMLWTSLRPQNPEQARLRAERLRLKGDGPPDRVSE